MGSKDSQPMVDMGTATIFPTETVLSSTICTKCNNRFRCSEGDGIPVIVRGIRHLFLPDYENSWTLSVDLPDCKQLNKLFSLARISSTLYTGNRAHVEGKIIESHISQLAELSIVEL
jgi:hypothetical protein